MSKTFSVGAFNHTAIELKSEWLIQHPDDSKFHFGWEDGEAGWTADIKWAIRSETHEDAEDFANNIGLSDWKVVEEPTPLPPQEQK